MKTFLIAASLCIATSALAADYPILKTYETNAEALREQTRSARGEDTSALVAGTQALIEQGVAMMRLYADKNPNCQAQFDAMIADVPQMGQMKLEELHSRYHNGVGLPTAPKHCYFGRSQVVHPAMNVVRLQGAWSEEVRGEVDHDLEEVIEHLARIQKNLDTPPN